MDERVPGGMSDEPLNGGWVGTADPCAALRALAEEHAAAAEQMRAALDEAGVEQQSVYRAYSETSARSEAARRAADRAWMARVKEDAQAAYRRARTEARSLEDLQRAASAWLSEIDRLNRERRVADVTLLREREQLSELQARVEELAITVDATRVSAEAAERASLDARQALARCEGSEELRRMVRPGLDAPTLGLDPVPAPVAAIPHSLSTLPPPQPQPQQLVVLGPPPTLAALEPSMDDFDSDGPAPILRLLAGEAGALDRLTRRICGSSSRAPAVRDALSSLNDALHERARRRGYLEFPEDHPFWGQFQAAENHAIAAALADLGFGYDGRGGYAADRPPAQRELAMAIGHAGHDPKRLRRLPAGAELDTLYEGVRVAADRYLLDHTESLTAPELVGLLGPNAGDLDALWEDWDRVREQMLGPAPARPNAA